MTKQNTMHLNHRRGAMQYSDIKTKIKGLTVQSLDGKNVPVESLWASHRIVLAFLRHFG